MTAHHSLRAKTLPAGCPMPPALRKLLDKGDETYDRNLPMGDHPGEVSVRVLDASTLERTGEEGPAWEVRDRLNRFAVVSEKGSQYFKRRGEQAYAKARTHLVYFTSPVDWTVNPASPVDRGGERGRVVHLLSLHTGRQGAAVRAYLSAVMRELATVPGYEPRSYDPRTLVEILGHESEEEAPITPRSPRAPLHDPELTEEDEIDTDCAECKQSVHILDDREAPGPGDRVLCDVCAQTVAGHVWGQGAGLPLSEPRRALWGRVLALLDASPDLSLPEAWGRVLGRPLSPSDQARIAGEFWCYVSHNTVLARALARVLTKGAGLASALPTRTRGASLACVREG